MPRTMRQISKEWYPAGLYSLHRAFSTVDIWFNDFKKVRLEINDVYYIRSSDLKQLEIDWGRFRKIVGSIGKDLQDGQNFLPNC